MKGARRRAGGANGPRGFSDDELCPENIYKIYHEAIEKPSEEQSNKFKERFKERFNLDSNEGDKKPKDYFSMTFTDIEIDLLFNQLNSANLEDHFAMLPKTTWTVKENDDDEKKLSENNYIRYKIERHNPNSITESDESIYYRFLCFDCYFHRRKNLIELLKKINPYCDPDEAKIEKVLEKYKIYKEPHSGEEDLQKKQECKTALKQAINDALKTDMFILPTIDLAKSTSAKYDLEKKINLALNSQSDKPPNPGSVEIKINLLLWEDQSSGSKSISNKAFETILFHIEPADKNEERDLNQPRKILKTLDEFKDFLAENVSTNLDENKVKEAFKAYKIYYNMTLEQSDISVKLKKSQEIQLNGVSDYEFDGIVSFLDRMRKTELNASSAVNKPLSQKSAQGESIDESEPTTQLITVEDINRDKVVDIKRDKVAEFKKFLEDNQLNCSGDNIQKVFALHELYEAYKPHLKKPDDEIQGEISITPENLEAFKDQISGLIFKKELSGSLKCGDVPVSSLKMPRVKLDQNKLEEILTFLNENQESEKIDNSWEILNPPLDLHDDNQAIFKYVELFKESKKVAITERLASWYSEKKEGNKIQEAFIAYEAYANAASIQDKQAHKAIILFKLTKGDQDVTKNLEALEFLKILDTLNNDSIASYQKRAEGKAMREKPNEIIKFFFEDLPNTILSVFDCIRTDKSSSRDQSNTTQ